MKEKESRPPLMKECPECGGTGKLSSDHDDLGYEHTRFCPKCHGTNEV